MEEFAGAGEAGVSRQGCGHRLRIPPPKLTSRMMERRFHRPMPLTIGPHRQSAQLLRRHRYSPEPLPLRIAMLRSEETPPRARENPEATKQHKKAFQRMNTLCRTFSDSQSERRLDGDV